MVVPSRLRKQLLDSLVYLGCSSHHSGCLEDHVVVLGRDIVRMIREVSGQVLEDVRVVCGLRLGIISEPSNSILTGDIGILFGICLFPRNRIIGWRCCQSARVIRIVFVRG